MADDTEVDFATSFASSLMTAQPFTTFKDTIYIYRAKKGTWRDNGDAVIRKLVRRSVLKKRIRDVNEVVSKIHDFTMREDVTFYPPVRGNLLNLKNGVLDMDTLKLQQYSPKHYFIGKLPVEYKSEASTEDIAKFLRELSCNTEGVFNEKTFTTIKEELGYILIEGNPLQKGIIQLGITAANGKSTLNSLIEAFLGKENTTTLTMEQIANEKFKASELFGKLANVGAELSSMSLKHEDIIKALLGSDEITFEEKFKKPFKFKNKAKLIFSANSLPHTKTDAAWNRRWQIINFENRFVGDKRDNDILRKLTTPENLSGMLNLALETRKTLLTNRKFTYEDTEAETERKYLIGAGDSIKLFTMDMIEPCIGHEILKSEVYGAYFDYCGRNKFEPKNLIQFGMYFKYPQKRKESATSYGYDHYYVGIKLKEVPKEPDPDEMSGEDVNA